MILSSRHVRPVAATLGLVLVLTACADEPSTTVEDTSEAAVAVDDTDTGDARPTTTSTPTADATPSETETATEDDGPDLPPAPEIVRGVYSHVYSFWGSNWDALVGLVEDTEVNAVVVDVKDEAGTLLWDMDHPLAEAGGGGEWNPDSDPSERLQQLIDAGGYPIARVACFKDTLVAEARPDLAVQDQGGNTWKARKDFSWLNPYQDEAGQWCIDAGLEAVKMGFKEVQFDYIRFPNGGDGDTTIIQLPGVPDDRPREEWRHTEEITEFLARASEQIHEAGAYVSADLFGLVTYDFSWDAQGTGQVIEQIAEHVDFISPMVYPSHYGPGNYGLEPHPVDFPYETVWNSMQEAQMRVQGLHAKIRPWLEDFPAGWLGRTHDASRVSDQLRATYENGIEGWMLWNAANTYSRAAIDDGEAVSKADPDFVPPARTANPDEAPNTIAQRTWPGEPECDAREGRLFIGEGNLAGTTPGTPSPAPVEPAADGSCPGDATDAPSESATATEVDVDSATEATTEPSPTES